MKTVAVSEETKEDLRILIKEIIDKKPSISFDELCKKYGGTEEEDNEWWIQGYIQLPDTGWLNNIDL